MSEAISAQNAPYFVDVEKGETYYWCACGRSKKQPFCDGAHKNTGIEPTVFTAENSESIVLCGCKKTSKAPFCDGSHSKS